MTHGTWRHDRCLDVDFRIYALIELPCSWKLSGFWVNRHVPDVTHSHDIIEIQKSDLHHWTQLREGK